MGETLTKKLERLHGFIYSVSGSGENEAHAIIREAIAALGEPTARIQAGDELDARSIGEINSQSAILIGTVIWRKEPTS